MRATVIRALALAALLAGSPALHAADSVSIAIAGLTVSNGTSSSRTSAPQTINPACRYSFAISDDAKVRGTGAFALVIPTATPLTQVLQQVGQGGTPLAGGGNNPSCAHPYTIPSQTTGGTGTLGTLSVTISLTVTAGTQADGTVFFNLSNVAVSPALGGFVFTQGSVGVTALCAADFTNDGGVTIEDLLAFLELYLAGDANADMDGDQGVTIDDLVLYLPHYFAGC